MPKVSGHEEAARKTATAAAAAGGSEPEMDVKRQLILALLQAEAVVVIVNRYSCRCGYF